MPTLQATAASSTINTIMASMQSPVPGPAAHLVSRDVIGRAVDALLKWMRARTKQRKAQLIEHDDLINLVLTLKKIPHAGRTNAYRLLLPHPLHSITSDAVSSQPSICLIVDDSSKSPLTPAAALSQIRDLDLPISEVLCLTDLKSNYRAYEARRKLCDSYDVFFADRCLIPLLPRLIGKSFFKKKKIPAAIDLRRKSWPEQLKQCCNSTMLYLRGGTCSGIKIGRVSQSRDDIVDNVMAALEGAVQHVPKKWKNVRSLHIKSVDSVALPIYQTVPECGMKIEVMGKKNKKEKKGEGKKEEIKKKTGRIHEVEFDDTEDGDGDNEGFLDEDYDNE